MASALGGAPIGADVPGPPWTAVGSRWRVELGALAGHSLDCDSCLLKRLANEPRVLSGLRMIPVQAQGVKRSRGPAEVEALCGELHCLRRDIFRRFHEGAVLFPRPKGPIALITPVGEAMRASTS